MRYRGDGEDVNLRELGNLIDGATLDASYLEVIKACQAISAEVIPERLYKQILCITIEVAGAEKGMLFLYDRDELRLRARAISHDTIETVIENLPLDQCADLPQSAIRHVAQHNRPLLLDDAGIDGRFIADAAPAGHKIRSVLCVPLRKQHEVIGVLYLENNALAGAFSDARKKIIEIFAAQAVISLEASHLFIHRERLEAIVQNSSDFIGSSDLQGNPIFVNRAGRDLVGIDQDYDIRLTNIPQYFVPEERQFILDTVIPAITNDGRWRGELTFQNFKTGARIPVFYDLFQVNDSETGQPLFFATVTRNIEDAKRREERQAGLLTLGDRLKRMSDVDDAMSIAANIIGDTLRVQRAGFGRIDSIGMMIDVASDWRASDDVVSIAGRHRFETYGSFGDDLKAGNVVAIDDVTTDARTIAGAPALEAIGVRSLLNIPVLDDRGVVALFFAHENQPRSWTHEEISFIQSVSNLTWAAITEANASAALYRLNSRLEQEAAERTADRNRLWQLSTDIMLICDLDGAITAVNPAWRDVLAWRDDELLDATIFELMHPDDVETFIAEVDRMRTTGERLAHFENRLRHRNGNYRWISWSARVGDGFVIAVGRDITLDLERAESMQRTEIALQQAQKMETIGKLTGGVAHDFNNLLQVISGNLQLLATDVGVMPVSRKRIENALASVERGAKLASSLLAFARKQPLEPKVIKVGGLIIGMEDMLRRSLGEEIEIGIVISPGLWSTAIDVVQVENALLNLAINARDAMDGIGKLTIEAHNVELDAAYGASHADVEPGQYVVIAVSDNGSGMPAEVLQQAFEPFFSTKPEGKGTGLGLSMVYGLVKQSGGHVKIYSEVGEGTTVKLYLPRSREVEDAYVALDTQPVVGGDETVLVVEDDDAVRSIAVEMLASLGYRVLKAPDANAALTVIESGVHVDLLFTDVIMPGTLRSPELARIAKKQLPELAVLFTSGYTENAIVHGGRLDRGVELIGKPYTKEGLARKIRQVLLNERRQRSGPSPEVVPDHVVETAMTPARPLNVLLVEDQDDLRDNTVDMIEFLGYQATAVANAEDALGVLSPEFDLLLTDMGLPGMQGDELVRRAQARFPGLHVIVASGFGRPSNLTGVGILPKPFTLDSLNKALAAFVRESA